MSRKTDILIAIIVAIAVILLLCVPKSKAESPSPDMDILCSFDPEIEWAYVDLEWMLEELCYVAFQPYFNSYFTNGEFTLQEALIVYPTHYYGQIEFSGSFPYEDSATAVAMMIEEITHNVIPLVGEVREGNVIFDFTALAPHTAYTMYLFVGW